MVSHWHLERNSQRSLNLPVPVTAQRAGNGAERAGTDAAVRIAEMGRVSQVVELAPQFKLESLGDRKPAE